METEEFNLPGLKRIARGKVRDIYQETNPAPDAPERLLIITTDRISAFDSILPTGIPDKGRVLTQMTLFWLDFLSDLVPNHLLSTDVGDLPAALEGRSMWVKRCEMFPVECVVRGYLAGSGWKDYKKTQAICGIPLPAGLIESAQLPEPIFTPATKAESGHDENISFEEMCKTVDPKQAERLRELTIGVYQKASEYAASRGIILCDTKLEFGTWDGDITLCDEVLTPDSSRFWRAAIWEPGHAQPSYDKQYVRDYLESIHWDKNPPAPPLPAEVAANTSAKYKEAYTALTGKTLEDAL